jgi:hypothetical protein
MFAQTKSANDYAHPERMDLIGRDMKNVVNSGGLHGEEPGLGQAGLSMVTLRARPKHRLGRGNRGLR